MNRAILHDASPSVKLIFAAIVVIFSWFIFQLIAIFSGVVIFSVGFNNALELTHVSQDPESIAFFKYVQAVTSTGLFIFSSFVIAAFLENRICSFLLLDKIPGSLFFILAGLLIIIILPFTNLLTDINESMQLPEILAPVQDFFSEKEMQMEKIMQSSLNVRGVIALIVNLLVIAVIPAIGEELLFRGVFQRLFIALTRNLHLGIFITAFLFSALHLQFLSFLPRFVLGMLFGYMVYWSRSLWPAILAHFLNNSLAVIYYHLLYSGKTQLDLENLGSPGHGLYFGLLSLAITAAIFFSLFRMKEGKRKSADSNSG